MYRGNCRILAIALAAGLVLAPGMALSAAPAPDPELNRALDRYRAHHPEEAERMLEQLVSKAPGNGVYWFNLGNLRYLRHDYAAALSAYEQSAKLSTGLAAPSLLYSARCLSRMGHVPEAWRILDELSRRLPERPELAAQVDAEGKSIAAEATSQAIASYKQKDYRKALELLDELKAHRPTDKSEFLRG